MALQGNPFLGKLKIPAPDLSRIPETPFEIQTSKPDEPKPSSSPAEVQVKTNRSQTVSNGFSNRFQTASDIGLKGSQTVSSEFTKGLEPPQEPISGNLMKPFETYSNRFQTVSETASDIGFKLPPIGELCVLRYLADHEQSPGAPITVRRRELATATVQTLAGVKTALIRLSRAQLIELHEFKRGKVNGFTSYRLTTQARTILASKGAMNGLGFNRFQTVSETVSIGCSSSSSSIVSENFKTTTTSELELFDDAKVQLSPEWAAIDVSPLADINFGYSHLIQLARQAKLSAAEVQDSIQFFAFDLRRNGKGRELKGPPLNFFMGIIRKGIPYAPPENYESPEQVARRIYLNGKRRIEEQRLAEEREIQDLEFSEWRRGLTHAQVTGLVPDVVRDIAPARESSLRVHFDEQVWPVRSETISRAVETERAEIRQQVEQSLGEVQP